MNIRKHKRFIKEYHKLDSKVQSKVDATILDFAHAPIAPHLRNHALHGRWLGFRSIDVTGDIRIVFKDLGERKYELVELIRIGTHSQLY